MYLGTETFHRVSHKSIKYFGFSLGGGREVGPDDLKTVTVVSTP